MSARISAAARRASVTDPVPVKAMCFKDKEVIEVVEDFEVIQVKFPRSPGHP
jgi:hypothetical protein